MSEALFYNQLANWRETTSVGGYKSWHAEQQSLHALHPSVALMLSRQLPKDYVQLALEYAHVSEKDATRLAYTRSEADGVNNRQLVTSIGKYLARHWAHVEDHLRRDVQAAYSPDTLVIHNTTPEIIRGIEEGPRSCMASVYNSIPFKDYHREQMQEWFKDPEHQNEPPWDIHPYSAYRPEYGWSIALRITPAGAIDGRALLYKDGADMVFLRTYRRNRTNPDGWSETDFTLTEWLKYQGYKEIDSWPDGAKLHTPDKGRGCIFAPYIDGECKGVSFDGVTTSVIVSCKSDSSHWCENTSALVDEREDDCCDDDDDRRYCESCDEYYDADQMCHAGRDGGVYICEGCRDNDYTWVRGSDAYARSGYRNYYILNENAGEILRTGDYVDPEYLPDNIVQLENDDYAEINDCVCIDGDYYLDDDPNVVSLEDPDGNLEYGHGLKTDCYRAEDGTWWTDETHYLEHNPVEEEVEVEDLTETVT